MAKIRNGASGGDFIHHDADAEGRKPLDIPGGDLDRACGKREWSEPG